MLSKISGRDDKEITPSQYQKCLEDCIVLKAVTWINEFLDHALGFKEEVEGLNNETIEQNFYMIDHNGSGFDTYIVLKNLPQWRRVVRMIRNGAGIIALNVFIE